MLVTRTDTVLNPGEIKQLIALAKDLPSRYPAIMDASGKPAPADIEFGFVKGKLQLFQIRPFLESAQARSNEYLNAQDKNKVPTSDKTVKLNEQPL